jgi:Right handed beta helix region
MTVAGRRRAIDLIFAIVVCVAAVAVQGCSPSRSPAANTPAGADQWPPTTPVRSGFAATRAVGDRPPSVEVAVPSPPTGGVSKVPGTIAADCSVDVAAVLEQWIASVPDNSTLTLGSNACYRIDETVHVEGRHRLLFEGNGATLKAVATGDRDRSQLQLKGGRDLTVRNLIVQGANPHAGATAAAYVPELEAQAAFQVNGATNVLFDRVHASDTYGDFVYIGPGNRQPSRNITVANSVFARSGRQGISVTGAIGVDIEANSIDAVSRSMFDLEANSRSAIIRGIRIVGNVTGAAVNFWLANKGFAADVGDITIARNRMDAATGGLLFVYARRGVLRGPFVIEQNRFIANDKVNDEDASGAFFFAFSTNVTIRDNDVTFPKGRNMPAVEIRNSHHVEVAGNHFRDAGRLIVASQGSSDYRAS